MLVREKSAGLSGGALISKPPSEDAPTLVCAVQITSLNKHGSENQRAAPLNWKCASWVNRKFSLQSAQNFSTGRKCPPSKPEPERKVGGVRSHGVLLRPPVFTCVNTMPPNVTLQVRWHRRGEGGGELNSARGLRHARATAWSWGSEAWRRFRQVGAS